MKIIKDDEIDLKVLYQVLWKDRKRIISITLFIAFLGVIYSLLVTPLYKSTITMYPTGEDANSQLGQLQGMATSLGLNIGNESTSFHILDIVNSRRIKRSLIYNYWVSENFSYPVNLIHYWDIDNENKINYNPINWIKKLFNWIRTLLIGNSNNDDSNKVLKWEESAIEKFNKRLNIAEGKTGLISIDILMEEPQLAAKIVNKMYPMILDFTIEEYAKSAKLNRQFIEDRQKEIEIQLTSAEDALKKFREKNRSILNSPQLQLEMDRLMREVEIKTQVYITLQQQYELARINEAKELPSVIILDEGIPAAEKNKPNRKLIVFVSLVLGSFIGSVTSIMVRYIRS